MSSSTASIPANNPTATNNSTPSTSTTAATPSSTPEATPTTTRRSARVHKRDPVVAPGFGTQRDLQHLSDSLGLPYPAVQAIMESRGRGMSRRSQKEVDAVSAAAATPISNAWADFMQDEGADFFSSSGGGGDSSGATNTAAATTTASSSATTAAAATAVSDDNLAPRDYMLPLVPRWHATSTAKAASRPSKKAKTTATTKETATPGILVQTGTLDANMVGRTKRQLDQPYDLVVPTVLTTKIRFTKIIASCSAAHMLAIDGATGAVYGWGRNEESQLGSNLEADLVATPTLLDLPDAVVDGAVGKSHSLILCESGVAYSVGSNKVGQCGVNSSTEHVPNWRKCVGIPSGASIHQVACGEQFTVMLTADGDLYTTGSAEFGQLGNGETGEHFITANKLAFANCNVLTKRTVFVIEETSGSSSGSTDPSKVTPLPHAIKLAHVSCGKNHAVALEAPASSGATPRVVTWGCGNYGCLGHNVQADSYRPRIVTALQGRLFHSNPPVYTAAGAHCSLVLTRQGHVYYWGKHRSVGEATMRPSLLEALANNGHVVTHVAAGSQTVVCSTESAVTVAWGQGPHGELGYGPDRKSSSKPQFVASLDKCRVADLACGLGATLFLVQQEDAADEKAVQQLPVLKPQDAAGLELL